jgi:hypothetical protein
MQEIDEAMVEGGNENCDHRMLVGEAQLPFHSVGLGERLDGGNILHADHHIDFETRYFFSRVEWEIAEFTISAGKIAASPSQLPTTRSSAAPGAWLQVETTGVTVHGSAPHFGVNAIYKRLARLATSNDSVSMWLLIHCWADPRSMWVLFKGGMNLNSVPDLAELRSISARSPARTTRRSSAGSRPIW